MTPMIYPAHFKLGMQLAAQDMTPAQRKNWAYDFSGEERLGVYLTNTLDEAEKKADSLFGPLRVITDEANAAELSQHATGDLVYTAVGSEIRAEVRSIRI